MGCGESKDAQMVKNPKVDIGQLIKNPQGGDPTKVVMSTPKQQAPLLETAKPVTQTKPATEAPVVTKQKKVLNDRKEGPTKNCVK